MTARLRLQESGGVLRSFRDAVRLESARRPVAPPAVRVPLAALVVAIAVLAVNIAMMLAGAWSTGVSIDEPTHLMRLQNFLDFGWYVETWELEDFVLQNSQKVYAYGPVAAQISHGIAVLAGVEEPGRVIEPARTYADIVASPAQYYVRHLVVAALASVGLLAVALVGRILSGSWRWGVLCAAVLSSVPMWTGHGMFNGKDIPVATGYTLVTLGCVAVSQSNFFASRALRYGSVLAVASGVILAVGTRPGIWPALAAGPLVALVVSRVMSGRVMDEESAFRVMLARAGLLLAGVAAGMALLAVAYPNAFLMPVQALLQSVQISSDFIEWDGWSLSAGVTHRQPPPWWYVPAWFGSQIPVLLLLAGTLGLAVALFLIVGSLRGRVSERRARTAAGLSAVSSQAVLVPLLSVVLSTRLYSGVRQLLFVVPALSVLVVVGIWWLAVIIDRSPGGASKPVAVAGSSLLAAALIIPTVDQGRLFPYNYVYFNEFAALKPIDGRWGTDYWQSSYRELARAVGRSGTLACPGRYGLDPERLKDPYTVAPKACQWPTIDPFLAARGQVSRIAFDDQSEFWFIQNNFLGPLIPSNCEVADSVHRSLHGQQVTMSYLALCPLPQAELDERAGSASGAS